MSQSLTRAERFVQYALEIGALELVPEGRPLKNGRVSPYFFNSGLFDTGEALGEIAMAYARSIIQGNLGDFYVLYGPPYKGTILAPAVAMILNEEFGKNARFCSSRKEAKDHGEGGVLIGSLIKAGDRVIIVDDVITGGGTKREAVELIKQYGGIPVGLIVALDRQERGAGDLSAVQEFEKNYGIPVHTICTLADIISTLRKKPEGCHVNVDEMIEKILAYYHQYGV